MSYFNLNGQDELEFYKMLIDSLSQMATVTVLGPDGKFLFTSQAYMKALNISPDDLKGKGSIEMIEQGYYGPNSSLEALRNKADAETIFYSKNNDFVLSESKVVLGENLLLPFVRSHWKYITKPPMDRMPRITVENQAFSCG